MVRSKRAGVEEIAIAALILFVLVARTSQAADSMVGIHSARVMSQSMPWMAQEAGLFKKYNLDFNLVFISSSSIVTAALLGGDAEMPLPAASATWRPTRAARLTSYLLAASKTP